MTTLEEERDALLQATLPHIAFDGWTHKAFAAGAADAGLAPAVALNAFPNGPLEALEAFSDGIDRRLLTALEDRDLSEMRVRDRIALGVRLRLEMLAPHEEAVRRGLSTLALPANAALGMTCLYRSVDAIWHAAGDRSTDYNFYSKRLLLAGVYSSTLLAWLNDSSEDKIETWAFLDRRIDEVLKVGGRFGKTMKRLLDLPDRLARRRPGAGMGAGIGPRRRRPFGPKPMRRPDAAG